MELRVLSSGSLGQQSAVHLVVAGQRGAGLLGDGAEGLVGSLILHAVQGVGQLVEQGLVGQRLRGRHRPEVHGARGVVADEAVVVVLVYLLQLGVAPDAGGRSPL